LNQHTDVSSWQSKTPFASIRRIVQDKRYFFKIRPGLWALNSYRENVLQKFNLIAKDKDSENQFNHTYYQGLVTEIGNLKGFITFIPNQDKNKIFLDRPIKEVAKLKEIFQFSYLEVVNRAKTIDVIWFNERKFPHAFFEIEHTTGFQNSLGKYVDFQDFNTKFFIVAPLTLRRKFEDIITRNVFKDIKSRTQFVDYEFISNLHTKTFEILELQKSISL
jgi:hypothetical protein